MKLSSVSRRQPLPEADLNMLTRQKKRGKKKEETEKQKVRVPSPRKASESAPRGPVFQLLDLQRKIGNRAFGQMIEESATQRQAGNESTAGTAKGEVPSVVQEVLRSPGQVLDSATQAFMEPRFGHDFSQVRVHTDARAGESADAVGATAYTVGKDVVFGREKYDPHTTRGRELLAHELAHVVQQEPATSRGDGGASDHAIETAANQAGTAAVRGTDPVSVARAGGLRISRKDKEEEKKKPVGTADKPEQVGAKGSPFQAELDAKPAQIDRSKGIDDITNDFYNIPIELIPPGTTIPSGPILTVGTYGCSLRRYGLTTDNFALKLEGFEVQSSSHPFMSGSGLTTVECWASSVRFSARLRQTIYLPNDVATHPCVQGQDSAKFLKDTLAHEHLHEADNVQAARECLRSLLHERLVLTLGVGRDLALVKITSNPKEAVAELKKKIGETMEKVRSEQEVDYAKRSAEFASKRDPWDRELHTLKAKLLEEARERAAQQGK